MSLQSAVDKLVAVLEIEGLPVLQMMVPANWLAGPYPGFYIDVDRTTYQYAELQAHHVTAEESICPIAVVIHQENVPQGMNLFQYRNRLVDAIKEKLAAQTRADVFENDGEWGFRVEFVDTRYNSGSEEPTASAVINLKISQDNP